MKHYLRTPAMKDIRKAVELDPENKEFARVYLEKSMGSPDKETPK